LRAANGRFEHSFDDIVCVIDGGAFAVHDQLVSLHAQRNRKSVFQSREILIELPEKTEVIAQTAQIDGSFGR
jgi:hypothetical protein